MSDEILFTQRINEELETDADLGTEDEDEFSVRLGDQPIGLRLRDVYSTLGKDIPGEYALYKMFEIWLIPHRLSLVRRRGAAEPTAVGIQIDYAHSNTTCCVVSLLPAFQYRQHGRAGVAISYQGKLSLAGEMIPMEAGLAEFAPKMSVGALSLGVTASGEVGFDFSVVVSSPTVAAVGVGSSGCEWRIDKQDVPLFGRTLETWSVLALPKRQRELSYRIRYYYLKRTFFITTRRESDPVEIKCQLAG